MNQVVPPGNEAAALKRYLSDEIAPMIFADSIEDVIRIPPPEIAQAIKGWVADQYRGSNPLPISDYLFHAAKKIHLLAELELVARDEMDQMMATLRPLLLSLCPAEDRQGLERDLQHLEYAEAGTAASLEVVHRPGTSGTASERQTSTRTAPHTTRGTSPTEAPGAQYDSARPSEAAAGSVAVPASVAGGLQRMNLLLDRLESLNLTSSNPVAPGATGRPTGAFGAAVSGHNAILAEIVDEVASSSRSAAELDNQLSMLQGLGVSDLGDGVIRVLTRSLPDWAPPRVADGTDRESTSGAARAMRRFVTLAPDRDATRKRFGELVQAAVEQFNGGSLGRSVTMFDLAERMIEQQEVESTVVSATIGQAFASLDETHLRQLAEGDTNRHLLRRIMAFFPQLAIEELLSDLEAADARDRRRHLISLLAAYGDEARTATLRLLKDSTSGHNPCPWFMERNLVYLLRIIPRSPDTLLDVEIDVLVKLSELAGPLPLIREALTALGQITHDRAEKTLIARMAELEDALLGRTALPHETDDLLSLLDSGMTQLARSASKTSRRAVLDHGLRRQTALGDTAARAARLGSLNLADDPPFVARLIEAIQGELPIKVFGVAVKTPRKSRTLERLIEALSSTDTPEVRKALAQISQQFATESFGQTAAAVLAGLDSPQRSSTSAQSTTASLNGDLAVFGLPNLLQNLADSRISGTLSLYEGEGESYATIDLTAGMLRHARVAKLQGEMALFQLFERPAAGRFVFIQRQDAVDDDAPTDALLPIMPLLLEGMRRYDEFTRAATLIPDDGRYRPTDHNPTNVEEGCDPELALATWERATAGATPARCEVELKVDSYQIRRLYEHWVAEGALVLARDSNSSAAS